MEILITIALVFIGFVVAMHLLAFAANTAAGIAAGFGEIGANIKELKELVIWHANQRKNPPAPWEKKNF